MRDALRRPFRTAVAVLVLLAVGAGLAAWFWTPKSDPSPGSGPDAPKPDPPPPDPRLVFDTPFRNVKPDVGYVGDARCAGCHAAITHSYHAHPMGRSADHVSATSGVERFDPAAHPSFPVGVYDLRVEQTPEGVRHVVRVREPTPTPLPDYVVPAHIAIGSGTRGRSYLTVDGGTIWQTPISWYGPDQRWNLSPGFRLGTSTMRAVVPDCLYCHVDRVEPVPGARNRYREPLFPGQIAIGCERCHGPGELHVAERAGGPPDAAVDSSIVNPRHLSPALRAAVCEQCHLQGEERITRRGRDLFEFRPGLPFEQFVSVFVRHPEIAEVNRSVGQFEQMEQSRCFTRSGGRLGCTTCHDPHAAPGPAERDLHYRNRCLTCHSSDGCSLPVPERQAKADSCIACHMPRGDSANVAHASVTDHRILRTPTAPATPAGLPFGTQPLVRFRAGSLSPPPQEMERDLGIALARFSRKKIPQGAGTRDVIRALAVGRLKGSLRTWPGDVDAWDALASARSGRGEAEARFEAASTAAALAPGSEGVLSGLAEAACGVGRYDVGVEAAGQLIRLSPGSASPLVIRAFVYLSARDWEKAEADARAALAVHPLHTEARLYLAICRHHRGDPEAGRREAQTAARLETDPGERAYLLEWYRRATQ